MIGWLLVGCVEDSPSEWLLDADYEIFVQDVQPIVAARCANPSCHGAAGRPFEIYAPEQHRLDPGEVFLDEALDEEELNRNFACSVAFIQASAEASPLLRKPLDPDAGGSEHAGGVQFGDAESSEYQTVLAWIWSGGEEE